jgi:uncharacterized protein
MHIEITFDPVKDAMNHIQHGFSLDLAREIVWDDVMCRIEERRDYGEIQEVGFVPFLGSIFCVVLTRRNTAHYQLAPRERPREESLCPQ